MLADRLLAIADLGQRSLLRSPPVFFERCSGLRACGDSSSSVETLEVASEVMMSSGTEPLSDSPRRSLGASVCRWTTTSGCEDGGFATSGLGPLSALTARPGKPSEESLAGASPTEEGEEDEDGDEDEEGVRVGVGERLSRGLLCSGVVLRGPVALAEDVDGRKSAMTDRTKPVDPTDHEEGGGGGGKRKQRKKCGEWRVCESARMSRDRRIKWDDMT